MLSPAGFAAERMRLPPRPLPYSLRSRGPGDDRVDVFDALRLVDAGDSATVRLLYSDYDIAPGARDREYAGGWTREHVFPQSHARMDVRRPGAGTDLHNIFAADASVNSARNDKDFDDCDGPDSRAVVDSSPAAGRDGRLLCRATAECWEPSDAAKGAVARALMYTACMYAAPLGLKIVDGRSAPGSGAVGRLSAVLRGHRAVPPTARERARNDAVERLQGNRNPFVDEPELADVVVWE